MPDFGTAYFLIQGIDPIRLDNESILRVFPNPFADQLTLDFYSHDRQDITIGLMSASGDLLFSKVTEVGFTSINHLNISEFQNLPNGVYFLSIRSRTARHLQRIVKISQ